MRLWISSHMVPLRRSIFAVAVLGFNAALSAQTSDLAAQVREMAGCYVTQLGDWSGPLPPTGLPAAHTPPTQFQLDAVPARLGDNAAFAVKPARLVEQSRMVATWAPHRGDSLAVVWSTGFIGVSIRFAVHHDSLVGRATTFHDAHMIGEPPDPTASVIAVRRPCQPK